MKDERVRLLNKKKDKNGPVIYWMSRDQRLYDNWAVTFAQKKAEQKNQPLVILFCLVKEFMGATIRQYDFMLQGLREVKSYCDRKNIPFYLMLGDPLVVIPQMIRLCKAGTLVTDFDPLRIKRKWKLALQKVLDVPFYEVDAHNIVPCWIASQKQEYGAYTLRPKLQKVLHHYLDEFPDVKKQAIPWTQKIPEIQWDVLPLQLTIDKSVNPIKSIKPGYRAGQKKLERFCAVGLLRYNSDRNDPVKNAQSGLSPYIHFGQISAQRVALSVARAHVASSCKDPYLEELIVRRELADNFCYYSPRYDSFKAFPIWAQNSLNRHWNDARDYTYSRSELERAQTHDPLWNAAQMEMVKSGTMHGYMRMYWAKKILEWTPDPDTALEACIYLNDKYELDGRDPNGYAGIAWSLGGLHDRAWGERPLFGKIRFMSYHGCKAKFDIDGYIEKVNKL
jgi:deoxyribodipyrimidine photo-lyase